MIDQAYSDLKNACGGVRNDYFGLLYVEKELKLPREQAVLQVAFGGNDYGIDGFHFDPEKRNLYLYQFKYSESHANFKPSFQRLIDAGMELIFKAGAQDQGKNQMLLQLKSCLRENLAVIQQVFIRFVFKGDPEEADRSQVLEKLREDLENKHYLVTDFFGRPITLVIDFRSTSGKVGVGYHERKTRTYTIDVDDALTREGPDGEMMYISFVRMTDLHTMYLEMGQRFFERNIRAALPEGAMVNRALLQAFKRIVLDEVDAPAVFAFNHNGITLWAERLERLDGQYKITEPRLMNGAQTVRTFARFLSLNKDNRRLEERRGALGEIRVICKIITNATPPFVTTVTINNNRQNPVEPWNLHANDMIQLQLHDKFLEDLKIYYERQQNAFANLSDEDLDEMGVTEYKAVELVRLAKTFLVSDGEIVKLSRMRQVFEEEKQYAQIFSLGRLTADSRKILLCYKIQFRLRRLLQGIVDIGPNKYNYIHRARNLLWALLCQAVLNAENVEDQAEDYGRRLTVEANYTEWLARLATTRCRFLISSLLEDSDNAAKAAEGNFGFFRTNTSYKKCMILAHRKWKWVEIRLR
jgi:hypothetical protein